MADTKITGLTAAAGATAAQEIPVNDATTDRKITMAQVKTFVNTAPSFAAGSATAASWPKLASGTMLTTPEAGAWEYDGVAHYLTSVASARQIVDAPQFVTLTSAYTLTSQTAAQKIFNSPANGSVAVQASTAYLFELFMSLTALSATSGSFGFAFGGTATLTAQAWWSLAIKAALATAGTGQVTYNTAANTTLVTANTTTTGHCRIWGKVRINAAGTLIPQISLGVAAAAIVGVDSFFRIWPMGAAGVQSVGNWT